MSIKITKNGFYKSTWNGKKQKDIVKKLKLDLRLFSSWEDTIELEDVTLLDLVKLMKKMDPLLFTVIEIACNSKITEFLKEVEEEPKNKECDISYIEISKYYETTDLEPYGFGKEILDAISCSGRKDGEETGYALEFTHWAELKDIPIKISDKADFLKHDNKKFKKLGPFNTCITMRDFFYGLFDELCFFGTPKNRNSMHDSINKSMKEIKDGTAKLVPFEEVEKEMESMRKEKKKK
jgi:hypothetical protein